RRAWPARPWAPILQSVMPGLLSQAGRQVARFALHFRWDGHASVGARSGARIGDGTRMKGAVNLRRIRLASGLILFAYVTTHYLNHALGLVSLAAMDEGSHVFLAVWRNPLGTTLLYGAVLVHFLLALWALFQRRSFRGLDTGDWAQL